MLNSKENCFDVLIVGGGIIGMLTARSLQSRGLSVAVLDKGRLGGEASWAAGGILAPLCPWKVNPATEALIHEGRKKFASFVTELRIETGIDAELLRSGMLVLDVSEQTQALAWAKKNREAIDVLTQQDLHKKVPNLSKEFSQALYLPNIEQVRPPNLIAAVRQSLHNRGIRVYESSSVTNILIESGVVSGVATRDGVFSANKVIVCSGAWTKNLLPDTKYIDVEPVRGQMLLYKCREKLISQIIQKDNSYVIPRRDGHILCGSTVEHVGFDNTITQDANNYLRANANELIPELTRHEPIKQWSALRPGTQRNQPYICKHHSIEGLFLNSGHYRYGIIMSIASARIMAELVTDSHNPSQISAFS